MEFDQKPCLETNIDFNTGKKTAPKNAFEKDIFKLMNNWCLVKQWITCTRDVLPR